MVCAAEQMLRLAFSVGAIILVAVTTKAMKRLVLKPIRLRYELKKQGIVGPPSSFLLGNLKEFGKSNASHVPQSPQEMTHNCASKLFSFFGRWRKEYGSTFMFSLGNIQILSTYNLDILKEVTTCTSLDLGKPSFQFEKLRSLLGQGILTANGTAWIHQRKIIAPELYPDKVKGMIGLIVESSTSLVNSWSQMIQNQGGTIDINIDKHMGRFSADVISRACFGSSYVKGEEIFRKLRELQDEVSMNPLHFGFPGLKYIPSKNNRKIWTLEKELRSLILDVVKERSKSATSEKDLLQMILKGAENSDFGEDAKDRFVVDNCKNIYWAGYETTAVSATWTLMLLASSPEWQAKVRDEVMEICNGQLPDADMVKKMKVLTMVINESLRLYTPGTIVSREALADIKFGKVHVPKGVNVWTLALGLHQDPEIWGSDAEQFNPERFVNGVSGACKLPHVFMPFGFGPRTCLGQTLALTELKILISMIVSKFSLSLSPRYKHSPKVQIIVKPEFGVDLLVEDL